jgi:prolipoprotein diacylglyceryl transferase
VGVGSSSAVLTGVLPSIPTSVLASIPSPDSGTFHVGPLTLRAYGFFIAVGVIAAVVIGSRRWVAKGGHPDTFSNMALWVVPLGVIGARLYHIATDYQRYEHDLGRTVQIWKGGLSIWGALGGGVLGFFLYSRQHHLPLWPMLDAVAPGLAAAQAIGRLGNWFNQELFGKPTDLPWGLEIAARHRPDGYVQHDTFHPTFLYESLWSVGVFFAVLAVERRRHLRRGQAFFLYGALYCVGRFWIELLRIDFANKVLGLRVNVWTTVILFVVCAFFFVHFGRKPEPEVAVGPPDDADLSDDRVSLDADGSAAADGRADAEVSSDEEPAEPARDG